MHSLTLVAFYFTLFSVVTENYNSLIPNEEDINSDENYDNTNNRSTSFHDNTINNSSITPGNNSVSNVSIYYETTTEKYEDDLIFVNGNLLTYIEVPYIQK